MASEIWRRPEPDGVIAECRGGPRDGEKWYAYYYGQPMLPDARLAGYVFERERLVLRWSPESEKAMRNPEAERRAQEGGSDGG